jgi:hypothetical protein
VAATPATSEDAGLRAHVDDAHGPLPTLAHFCYATSDPAARAPSAAVLRATLSCTQLPEATCELAVVDSHGGASHRRVYGAAKQGWIERTSGGFTLASTSGSAADFVTRYDVRFDETGRIVAFDGRSDGSKTWRAQLAVCP